MQGCQNSRNHHSWPPYIHYIYTSSKQNYPQPTQPQETKNYTYRCSVISNFKCNLTSQNCITGGHMKCKIENNKTGSGFYHYTMFESRVTFKYALRYCHRHSEQLTADARARNLLDTHNPNKFWKGILCVARVKSKLNKLQAICNKH